MNIGCTQGALGLQTKKAASPTQAQLDRLPALAPMVMLMFNFVLSFCCLAWSSGGWGEVTALGWLAAYLAVPFLTASQLFLLAWWRGTAHED